MNPVWKHWWTYIPGLHSFRRYWKGTGGTGSASYCYGVWIKHLALLHHYGMRKIPATVIEIGPGDSLGTGLAALLSGANHYIAFDVIPYASTKRNMRIFNELLHLFETRAPLPRKGWPDVTADLDPRRFPSSILSESVLQQALSDSRIHQIREAIRNPKATSGMITIQYVTQQNHIQSIPTASADLVFSHAVLEHVPDLQGLHTACRRWLTPQGRFSHQVDLESHGLTETWNGYWAYSDQQWKVFAGKKASLIQRLPLSAHLSAIKESDLKITAFLQNTRTDGISRTNLAPYRQSLSTDDLQCSGYYVQGINPG